MSDPDFVPDPEMSDPEVKFDAPQPSTPARQAPARVGILTAGTLDHCAAQQSVYGIQSIASMEGPPNPPDQGLLPFLAFSNRISRPVGSVSEVHLIGNIHGNNDFVHALGRMVEAGMDLILWWSFALIGLQQEPELDQLVRKRMAAGPVFIYPCFSGVQADAPRAFPIAGVVANPPYLTLCPAPPGHPLSPARYVGWGDTAMFLASWRQAGFNDGLPDDLAISNGHVLASWSIAATIGMLLNKPTVGRERLNAEVVLSNLSLPVNVFSDERPVPLDFLEPRFVSSLSRL